MYQVGIAAHLGGDLDAAERSWEGALTLFRREGSEHGASHALSGLADLALQRGEHARAAANWQERLNLTWDSWSLRWALEGLAAVAAACQQSERAARLLGAAEALRERLGAVLGPGQLLEVERTTAAARAALDEAAFAAAWAEGRRLSPEAARAEAALVAQETGPPIANDRGAAGAVEHGLTPRELEVVRLVAAGRSNREIADALFISVPTVKRHLSTVLAKLGLPSRSALTAYAHTRGLV
jgi:DNA-binding CsgD family transcriptional regulator